MGAEETEEVALLAAGGADGPEIREPRRESSAVRRSGTDQEKPKEQRVKFSYGYNGEEYQTLH